MISGAAVIPEKRTLQPEASKTGIIVSAIALPVGRVSKPSRTNGLSIDLRRYSAKIKAAAPVTIL